eukprot:symbB.v1.2.014991.t1/scaffold1092.1/size138572/2
MKPSFEWERSTGFGLAALRRMRRNSLHEATVAVEQRRLTCPCPWQQCFKPLLPQLLPTLNMSSLMDQRWRLKRCSCKVAPLKVPRCLTSGCRKSRLGSQIS